MKIVRKSNFDHEDNRGNQYFVAQELSIYQADGVAKLLNEINGYYGEDFYKVVPDDYVLPPDWKP